MNTKAYIAIGALVLLGFSHYLAFNFGKERLRTEILSHPSTSDTLNPAPRPPVHGEGPADPVEDALPPPIVEPPPTTNPAYGVTELLMVVDSLKAAITTKNYSILSLGRPLRKTITEYGHIVRVSADPASHRISWDWTPADPESYTRTIIETKYVPLDPPSFWGLGLLSTSGGGGMLGFKSIGIGRLFTKGTKPINLVTVKVEF